MDGDAGKPYFDQYPNFAALAANEVEGTDYRLSVVERPTSRTAIIAPHGGSIERRTSAIARAIAGDDFNLYLFEGLDDSGNFEDLHITSHRFDEPICLRMISICDTVVAVHGYTGVEPAVMLGGLDRQLIAEFETALEVTAVPVFSDDHQYPGRHTMNICNRGRAGRGVQLELSDALRGSPQEFEVVAAIRQTLVGGN